MGMVNNARMLLFIYGNSSTTEPRKKQEQTTFHYAGWTIRILIMVCYHPYIFPIKVGHIIPYIQQITSLFYCSTGFSSRIDVAENRPFVWNGSMEPTNLQSNQPGPPMKHRCIKMQNGIKMELNWWIEWLIDWLLWLRWLVDWLISGSLSWLVMWDVCHSVLDLHHRRKSKAETTWATQKKITALLSMK